MRVMSIRAIAARVCHTTVAIAAITGAACDDRTAESRSTGDPKPFESEREVVIYVSTDEALARPILDAFQRSSGITVRARYDGENAKATGFAAMIRVERDAPRADLFWSGECFVAAQLATELLVDPWRSGRVDQFPASLRGASGRWYGLTPRVRVLVYDPSKIAAADLPTSMIDLSSPTWKGRVAIADPRFGTTRGQIGALAAQLEAREVGGWKKWVSAIAANHPLILAGGNGAVVDAVARGEAALGLTDTDDVYGAVAGGASLAMVALRHLPPGESGGGAMVIPASVALVAEAPHPREASELMSFLLDQDVTQWMHQSRQGTLIVPEIAALAVAGSPAPAPEGFPLMPARIDPMRINTVDDPAQFDADELAAAIDKAIAEFMNTCRAEPR